LTFRPVVGQLSEVAPFLLLEQRCGMACQAKLPRPRRCRCSRTRHTCSAAVTKLFDFQLHSPFLVIISHPRTVVLVVLAIVFTVLATLMSMMMMMTVSSAETGEPIETPFGVRSWVGRRNHALGRGPDLTTPRSTQPCIPPGSLNRVPASAEVMAGMSPLPGGR